MTPAAVLARARTMAQALMSSTWQIDRPTGEATVTDYRPQAVTETVYRGPGKLQTYEGYEQSGTSGPATTQSQRYSLHLPVGGYMPRPGDVATCVHAPDALLIGRRVRIAQLMPVKDHASAYRCFVDEITDPEEV